ncbi:MAG: hypothetical protein ACOCSM_02630 [Bacillota bacterium]
MTTNGTYIIQQFMKRKALRPTTTVKNPKRGSRGLDAYDPFFRLSLS